MIISKTYIRVFTTFITHKNFKETTIKMLSGMMSYLRKTRPETHSTAFTENSKTIMKRKKNCCPDKL